jgi:hypothetical protein
MRFLLLCVSLCSLAACGVRVPNIKICAAAGAVSAGANCAYTLSSETEEMDFDQFLDFLEPNDTRGGAVCSSVADWIKLKSVLESVCNRYGCSREEIDQIKLAGKRAETISR